MGRGLHLVQAGVLQVLEAWPGGEEWGAWGGGGGALLCVPELRRAYPEVPLPTFWLPLPSSCPPSDPPHVGNIPKGQDNFAQLDYL